MGLELTEYLRYAAALFFVLALIGLLVWTIKRFGGGKMTGNGKRGRRLAVSEAAMVDKRRRLVLIRRDNHEHLVMIGGPQDLVIETGIPINHVNEAPRERPRPPEDVPQQVQPMRPEPEPRPPVPPRPRAPAPDRAPERPARSTPPEREAPVYSDRQAPEAPQSHSTEQSAQPRERRSLLNVRPGETR